jgi:hypothetical protein
MSETIHINLSPLNLLILLIIGLQAKMTVQPLSPSCNNINLNTNASAWEQHQLLQ